MNEIYLTEEQLAKIKEEHEFFIHVKRPEIVERIKEAKSYGDLSENSEYDSAREEQAFVEAKIKELDTLITNAKIITDVIGSDIVVLGTTVTYEDLDSKQKYTYKIVGVGANPLDEKTPSISTNTPIARALLGKKAGVKIVVEIPNGRKNIKIIKIK
ncbi:MAG: transcription elongation factor GreA [Mycoplasmatales bacterium]